MVGALIALTLVLLQVGSRVCSEQPIICWKETSAKKKKLLRLHFVPYTGNTWGPKWRTQLLNFPALETTGDPITQFLLLGLLSWFTLQPFISKWWASSLSMCCNHPNKNGPFAWFMYWEMVWSASFLVLFLEIKFCSTLLICIKDVGASLY